MRNIALGVIGTLFALIVIAAGVVYSGFVDVAADSPHAPPITTLIGVARERAVARSARGITVPDDLSQRPRVQRGAGNYEAMCSNCHLSPERDETEIYRGLYPTPPDLVRMTVASVDFQQTAARQFWIIKHGIKASGMPAWSKAGLTDEDVWDLVAFLPHLRHLSAQEYRELVRESPGHAHSGLPGTSEHVPPREGIPGRDAHMHRERDDHGGR